jgi:hypothetical protein
MALLLAKQVRKPGSSFRADGPMDPGLRRDDTENFDDAVT